MRTLLSQVRTQGVLALARKFTGSLALHGWARTIAKVRKFAAGTAPPAIAPTARVAYEEARVAQYEFCRRWAERPLPARQRMLARLVESEPDCKGIVLCPLAHDLSMRERPEQVMRAWAEAGYLCLLLPIDSAVPSVERLGDRFYLAQLYPDAFAYFRDRAVVLYVSETMFGYVPRLLNKAYVVYDVVHLARTLALYGPKAAADHEALLARADVTLFSSEKLARTEAARNNLLLIGNGVFGADFTQCSTPPAAPPTIVGYHGRVSELLDFELLEALADETDVRLVIAGPVAPLAAESEAATRSRAEALFAHPHVEYLGTAPYANLAEYFARIHCTVIPWVADDGTNDAVPLELLESLAAGKRVITLGNPANRHADDTVFVADRGSLLHLLSSGKWARFDAAGAAAIARAHEWKTLLQPATAKIDAWIESLPAPAISVPPSLRVDIINFNFFDWNGDKVYNGGAERYVRDLALLCRKLGLEPRLLQNAVRPFTRDYQGLPVVGIPLTERFDLARMSAAYEPHLAQSGLVVASPFDLAARLGPGHRIVGISHGIHWDNTSNTLSEYSFERHRLVFDALQVLDACVCVDTNFINWVRSHDWHLAQLLEYIPNYVDLDLFRPRAKDFDAERLEVLYPRRLYRARGFQDTLEACDALLRRGLPLELHLCGGADAPEATLARAFVSRHPGRARHVELGIEDMHLAFEASHIVLIPTNYSEGTSLSCIEAMATRNGIVATTIGGLPNLVLDGYNGLLVKPGAFDLGRAIERLVDDRELLATLAENALQVAGTLSRARWEQSWTGVLQRLLPGIGARR